MDGEDVDEATAQVHEHPIVEWGARLGFTIVGVLHLIIGYIALKVAWGFGGGTQNADSTGALQTMASSPFGPVLLWMCVAGFVLLGLWSVTEGLLDRHNLVDFAKRVGKGAGYLFLAWTAFKIVALGSTGDSSEQTQGLTAAAMSTGIGRVAIGAVGVGIIGVAGYHVYKGLSRRFLQDLQEHPRQWVIRIGQIGYTAKGFALGVVGYFFCYAALTADPNKTTGLDGALKSFNEGAAGPYVLSAVAAGIGAYGMYSFARAKYASL
ncbi:MAG: DUF1206 domain-containing protein [Actinomycetales bacterium]